MSRVNGYTRNGKRVKAYNRKGGRRSKPPQPGILGRLFGRRRKPTDAEVRAFKAGRSTDGRAARAYAAGEDGQSEFKKRKAQAAAARRRKPRNG